MIADDAFSQVDAWTPVIVVPLTAWDRREARGPTIVPLAPAETGLRVESFVL